MVGPSSQDYCLSQKCPSYEAISFLPTFTLMSSWVITVLEFLSQAFLTAEQMCLSTERTAPVAFLVLKTDACENVLCTLGKNQAFQQSLDLVFQLGEKVTFKAEGTGKHFRPAFFHVLKC